MHSFLNQSKINYLKLLKSGLIALALCATSASKADIAVRCADIKGIPARGYDTLIVKESKGSYRYWRFVPPKGKRCNIAELSFLGTNWKSRASLTPEGKATLTP